MTLEASKRVSIFPIFSFSTNYFSTPGGMSKQKKSFTLSEQDYH